jgi:ferritin-like metal-binding protein YciE
MTSTAKKKAAEKNTESGTDLRELLVMKIKVLYGIEADLQKTFLSLAKKAHDGDLKGVLEECAERTEGHAKRLARIFELLGVKAQKAPSEAIRGLVADAEWIAKNIRGAAAQDAALVPAVCAIERHKAAVYEAAIVWAKLLEKDEAADLLEQTLEEEGDVDEELGDLAELKIYEKALPEDFDLEDDDEEEGEDDEEEDGDDEKGK